VHDSSCLHRGRGKATRSSLYATRTEAEARGDREKKKKGCPAYWIIFSLFTLVEFFFDLILAWVLLYYEIKLIGLLWLALPQTRGAFKLKASLERIRQASFAFTGVICQEEFDISDKLIVDCCNKEICRECMHRYIACEFESRRFPVCCLFSPECGDQFSESTLNLIATDEQLQLLHEWSRRPTLGSHQCPAPNCTGYSLQDDGANVRCHQCLLCHHQWCSGEGCEQADLVSSQHAGITCEAYVQWRRDNAEGDALFGDFVATQLANQKGADRIRKCPQCGFAQSKDSCDHGYDDRGRGHDDCNCGCLELVLRDVDVTLIEAEVAAAGDSEEGVGKQGRGGIKGVASAAVLEEQVRDQICCHQICSRCATKIHGPVVVLH
jgi:hypothetical protein